MNILTPEEREYLIQQMKITLDNYGHYYNEDALEKIIDTWAKRKLDLIGAFKKHPNYLEGKFMIAFDVDFAREIDKGKSNEFSWWLQDVMPNMKDSHPEEIKIAAEEDSKRFFEQWNFHPRFGDILPERLYRFLENLAAYAERTVSEETAKMLDEVAPNAHIHAGMKTSRAVNKLCTYLGYDKHPDYNKKFATYADSLSPLKIKRHTILSINPVDYLTMSIGNSWTSCHSIDTVHRNEGEYSSGTISYMLDNVSMVFYTVGAEYEGDEYFHQKKLVRQVFCYGEDKLVQSRLYPQRNDSGSREFYDEYRAIVQKIVSEIFEFPNLWTMKRGTDAIKDVVKSYGTQYEDYIYFDNCTLSRPKGTENENDITIGQSPICIECGYEHNVQDSINCCSGSGYTCANCGCHVSEDDACWIEGEPYCSDCVTWCECCDNYDLNENTTWIESESRSVCDWCLERYYTRCPDCGEWIYTDDMTWIEGEDKYVCRDCYDSNYGYCYNCNDVYHNDDLCEHDGEWYCPSCYADIMEEENEAEAS